MTALGAGWGATAGGVEGYKKAKKRKTSRLKGALKGAVKYGAAGGAAAGGISAVGMGAENWARKRQKAKDALSKAKEHWKKKDKEKVIKFVSRGSRARRATIDIPKGKYKVESIEEILDSIQDNGDLSEAVDYLLELMGAPQTKGALRKLRGVWSAYKRKHGREFRAALPGANPYTKAVTKPLSTAGRLFEPSKHKEAKKALKRALKGK
jgi:hypothetical protein